MSSPPTLIRTKPAMRAYSRALRSTGATLALVPTMGALHAGHLALVASARRHASAVVVSIYLNPAQFAPSEDLATYPRDLNGDLRKLAETGDVDAVFCPEDLYEVDVFKHETWVRVEGLEKGLCGRSRPITFRGVATVVAKLFNVVEPDVAIFGKKDFQQWRIICRMVRQLDFAVKVVAADLVREADGLALSSRNIRLTPEERKKAVCIYQAMSEVKSAVENGEASCKKLTSFAANKIIESGGKVDYVEIVDQESLEAVDMITGKPVQLCVAAWFGNANVRLIDNMEIGI